MEEITMQFEEALIKLDRIGAQQILVPEEGEGDPIEVINQVVVPAMKRIGDAWQDGSLSLSQIYMSGRICEQIIDELLPATSHHRIDQPAMAIAVLNDYHLLGKRIVYSQIRSAGYVIKDYGKQTVDELVEQIIKDEIEVVLISTLMYPSALDVKLVKERLMQEAPDVKILVGGAPFNMDDTLWQQVGADAMGYDGMEALAWIQNFIAEQK